MSKKKVCIIGAGTAGMSACWSLSRFPSEFDVTVLEKKSQAGGVATTEKFEVRPGVFCELNDGVQGGSSSYRNSIMLHRQVGFEPKPVDMRVSFGRDERSWTNYLPAESNGTEIQQLENEIRRFGRYLKIISWLEPIFIFIPIWLAARIFFLSRRFTESMLFPLTALFFGTGNQTANVSSALISRVFLDRDLKLFDYNSQRLLASKAEMFAFDKLREIYRHLVEKSIEISGGQTKFHFNVSIKRINGTSVFLEDDRLLDKFDQIIFACDAETILDLVERPTKKQRTILGNVHYFDDVTFTHTDLDYMKQHYQVHLDTDQYFIYSDPNDPEILEMSFNLSNYQPHLIELKQNKIPELNIFQTIFLNKLEASHWTIDRIDKSKVLLERWWRQFAHVWQHFLFTVPLMRFLQFDDPAVLYAGAYTMFNTHEIACISGLAAAHRLGAPYPFENDELAVKQFDLYLSFVYGVQRNGRRSIKMFLTTFFSRLILLLAFILRRGRRA